MKKKVTIVAQPDKVEAINSDHLNDQTANAKMYRDHKICDHYTHGRANKFPFGSSHGPAF